MKNKQIDAENCKNCAHFKACCKWTDFPKQIGFPICREFIANRTVTELANKITKTNRQIFDDIFDKLMTSFPTECFINEPCKTEVRIYKMINDIRKKYTGDPNNDRTM